MFRKLQKSLMGFVVKPLLTHYLKKERTYRWKKFEVRVRPGVFHPGLFYSTRFLLNHLEGLPLEGKSFLELGAGSGLIAIYAASLGAIVTASDIHEDAVEGIIQNAARNKVELQVIHSDLFQKMPAVKFDLIVINPPYYKRKPETLKDHAWYAGENLEYFSALFRDLGGFIHAGSVVLMILSEDCDLEEINRIAANEGFVLLLENSRKIVFEWNYIFSVSRA